MFSIDIPRRGRICSQGGESFEPGIEYYSLLIEQENEKWQRLDFCVACWPEAYQKWADKLHTHWKSRVPQGQQKKDNTSRNEKALELLRIALQNEDHAEAFVLALFLVRSRVLASRQQMQHEGKPVILYEVLATEEMLPVQQIPLSQLQVDKLQAELANKLNMPFSK